MKFFRYLMLIASVFSPVVSSLVLRAHIHHRNFLVITIKNLNRLRPNVQFPVDTYSSKKVAVQLFYDVGRPVQQTGKFTGAG